jgi:Flp pilus assembly protein TadG
VNVPAVRGSGGAQVLSRRPGRVNHRRRGIGMLFFTLIGMPVLFLSAAFAVDFTAFLTTARQAENVAYSAALAAAHQFAACPPGEATAQCRVLADDAAAVAAETIDANIALGTFSPAVLMRPGSQADIAVEDRELQPGVNATQISVVVVTIEYDLTNMVFLPLLSGSMGSPEAGPDGTIDGSDFHAALNLRAQRHAFVCTPGLGDGTSATSELCSRPF